MGKYQVIKTSFASLSYAVYNGGGNEVLLFFPGFGQDEIQYRALLEVLGEKYKARVIAIDLFYHGNSEWLKQEQPILIEEWKHLMELLVEKESIQKWRLMGYSMGGRFAMLTASLFIDRVEHLSLVAPDGITLSGWYKFAVENPLSRGVFKNVVLKNSSFLRRMAERISLLGLLDKKVYRFSISQLQTKEQRERVYYSWVVFRNIQVNIVKFAELLNSNKIPVDFYIGEHDRMITVKRIQPLMKLLPDSTLFLYPSGHTHLLNDIAKKIKG